MGTRRHNSHPGNQAWYRSLAILFRDNRPLLTRSLLNSGSIVDGNVIDDEGTLVNQTEINQLDWTVFTSLDSIDATLDAIDNDDGSVKTGKSLVKTGSYVGSLQPSDTHRILGYVTATRIKFILVMDSTKPMPRENEVRNFFEDVHTQWVKLAGNPFYTMGKVVKAGGFVRVIDDLLVKL